MFVVLDPTGMSLVLIIQFVTYLHEILFKVPYRPDPYMILLWLMTSVDTLVSLVWNKMLTFVALFMDTIQSVYELLQVT